MRYTTNMPEQQEKPSKRHIRKTVHELFPTASALEEQIRVLQGIVSQGGPLADHWRPTLETLMSQREHTVKTKHRLHRTQ